MHARSGGNAYPLWCSQFFLQDSQSRCDPAHHLPDGLHPLLHLGKVARRVRGIELTTLRDETASQDPDLAIQVVRLLQDNKSEFNSIGLSV